MLRIFILLLLAQLLNTSAFSESLSLDTLRDHMLLNSPMVAKVDASFAEEFGAAIAIRQLQNPQLSANIGIPHEYDDSKPDTQLSASISIPLRLSDFGLRSSVGDLLSESLTVEKQVEIQRLIQQLSINYFTLWSLQVEESHLEEQLTVAKKIVRLHRKPTAQGQVTVLDREHAQANKSIIDAKLIGLKEQQYSIAAKLIELSAYDISGRQLERPKLASLPAFEPFFESLLTNPASLIARTKLFHELKNEQLALAKRDAVPSLSPQIGYSYNEDGDSFIGIGISLPLPFFNRNQGSIHQRESERRSAQRGEEYFKSKSFREEVRLKYTRAQLKVKQASIYENDVLPHLKRALLNASERFEVGQLSLLELWNLQLQYHEALDQSLKHWLEAFSRHIELSILSGELHV